MKVLVLVAMALCLLGTASAVCPDGKHFCRRINCPFNDMTICQTLGSQCQTDPSGCWAAAEQYCSDNPSDPGCCISGTTGGFICPADGTCHTSLATCNFDLDECVDASMPCQMGHLCKDKYFCGQNQDMSPQCRDAMADACLATDQCQGKFPCGDNGECASSPTTCTTDNSGNNNNDPCNGDGIGALFKYDDGSAGGAKLVTDVCDGTAGHGFDCTGAQTITAPDGTTYYIVGNYDDPNMETC